jgi:hypothetical protein
LTQFHSQRHLVAINDSLVHEYQRGDEIWVQVDGFMQMGVITQLYFDDLIVPMYKVMVGDTTYHFVEQTVQQWQSSYSMIA